MKRVCPPKKLRCVAAKSDTRDDNLRPTKRGARHLIAAQSTLESATTFQHLLVALTIRKRPADPLEICVGVVYDIAVRILPGRTAVSLLADVPTSWDRYQWRPGRWESADRE